ncbi:MAG: cytochrome c peroxidase [Gemmatimonadota bacterium]
MSLRRFSLLAATLAGAMGCLDSSAPAVPWLDDDLRPLLAALDVRPLQPPAPASAVLVELGRLLMFDKVLSGNKNIACGSCHHPSYHTTDNSSLPIGEGGRHIGPARQLGTGARIPRNTPDLYNRGVTEWTRLFWDGRVAMEAGRLVTPAGSALPSEINSVLAAQAMFPVLDADEMRGHPGDTTTLGGANELARLSESDLAGIWAAIMRRVLAIPEYRARFLAAFPTVDSADLGFQHAALAIAAFEAATFTLLNSPFDRYLRGDAKALGDDEKRGALLFYGRARCAQCHSGPLLSDQQFHNIGSPQLGPGRPANAPEDRGRAEVTGLNQDRFAFRTPPLRNVAITGPWMHDGAYTTLVAAVAHYRNPTAAFVSYDRTQLEPALQSEVVRDPTLAVAILSGIDPVVREPISLSDEEVQQIVAFLVALTDPTALDQVRESPGKVPSGLPFID